MLCHALKDCPSSYENPQQKNGDLQYVAWLRGEPIRVGFKDPPKPSMEGEGGGRNRAARVRSEKGAEQPRVAREKSVVGGDHVPRLTIRSDASPTQVETKQHSLKHPTKELHKEGKVNKGDEKLEEKGLQFCEKLLESLLAQPVICEGMQWEKATSHEAEPKFKFELAPNQSLKKQMTSPNQFFME